MTKGRPVRARVRAAMAALAVGGALALSGCGEAGVAAIVDGRVIAEKDAQIATEQLNEQFKPSPALTTKDVVNLLIWAPTLIDQAASMGQAQSDSVARSRLSAIKDPTPATIELVRAEGALSTMQSDPTVQGQMLAKIKTLKVTVNPRYGTFVADAGTLQASTPNWLPKPAAG